MISEKLEQAREFEELNMKKISPEERPAYHVTASTGWLNDPNGFSFYKGEYHLFYQYHPYSNAWGPMHWGHVKSRDLLTWERLPAAMAPDEEYDSFGCFSGSALELADGRHLLMYTGVKLEDAGDGKKKEVQTQCVAVGDGVNYEKFSGNPVLTGKDLPQGCSDSNFRDPKIWQEEDGTFFAVTVNLSAQGDGQALLYKSRDGRQWERCAVLDRSEKRLGVMWECPDFFPLDGKQVLMVSPMEMKPDGEKFHVGHGTAVLIGTYDSETYRFVRETADPVDWGIDFYAPQTMRTPDGRRVMIGWMQAWSNSKFVPEDVRYFGQLSVPRELEIRRGRLFQNPVRELEAYRGEAVSYRNISVTGEMTLEGVRGRVADLTVCLRPKEDLERLQIRLACDQEFFTSICYLPKERRIIMDRSAGGYPYDILHSREIPVQSDSREIKLRLLLDRYSVELFINDGAQAASLTIFTPLRADGIVFCAKGTARMDVEMYPLLFS